MKHKQLPWMQHVQVGDVLLSPRGTPRIVRKVSRFADGELRAIDFAIKRCSWTHRPFTCYGYSDLCMYGWHHTGVNVPLDKKIDKRLAAELANCHLQKMDCCDVTQGQVAA